MDKDGSQRAREVMHRSIELLKSQQESEALQILDEFLAEATHQNWGEWARLLSGVAAIVAEHKGDFEAARRYYELRLPYVSDNDRAFALYNHARWLSVRGGRPDLAKEYATTAYQLSIARLGEPDRELVEAILERWPDVVGSIRERND